MGGIRAATEFFLLSVAGRETYESLDSELRERLLLNGDVLLNIETSPYLEYEPTATQLASVRLPRLVTASADNRDTTAPGHWRYQAAAHLASQLGTPLVELPGTHVAYLGLRPQGAPGPPHHRYRGRTALASGFHRC